MTYLEKLLKLIDDRVKELKEDIERVKSIGVDHKQIHEMLVHNLAIKRDLKDPRLK